MIVGGLVQGVGFRMFIKGAAEQRRISGWVRNLPDGSVEFEAQGLADPVDELIALAKRGPSRSHVREVTVREKPLEKGMTRFAVID